MDFSWLARSGGLTRQGLRFATVGSVATATQLGLYALLSGLVGAQVANVTAWLVSTMVGNAAQQRFTFQVPGARADSDRAVGLVTSLAGLGASSLVLALLPQPDLVLEVGADQVFRFVGADEPPTSANGPPALACSAAGSENVPLTR